MQAPRSRLITFESREQRGKTPGQRRCAFIYVSFSLSPFVLFPFAVHYFSLSLSLSLSAEAVIAADEMSRATRGVVYIRVRAAVCCKTCQRTSN